MPLPTQTTPRRHASPSVYRTSTVLISRAAFAWICARRNGSPARLPNSSLSKLKLTATPLGCNKQVRREIGFNVCAPVLDFRPRDLAVVIGVELQRGRQALQPDLPLGLNADRLYMEGERAFGALPSHATALPAESDTAAERTPHRTAATLGADSVRKLMESLAICVTHCMKDFCTRLSGPSIR